MRTVELFAGVGGFRVGLNRVEFVDGEVKEDDFFDFVWANQFEPKRKKQVAYNIYKERFGECDNRDICTVDKSDIPDHDLLVAGFPCQDFSVINRCWEGIQGKTGVLWWEIYETLKEKMPKYGLFENVDYLLKSPSQQRGRDFAILLYSLWDLGYTVEWRVIKADEYGQPQKRRRVFIFISRDGYHEMFDEVFPAEKSDFKSCSLIGWGDVEKISDDFSFLFGDSGLMEQGLVSSWHSEPICEPYVSLRSVLDDDVDEKYLLGEKRIERFRELKSKNPRPKKMPDGTIKNYWQGAVPFPDKLDSPARTIITTEANTARTSHVVEQNGVLRVLTPTECERIQTFPVGWTDIDGCTDRDRYFVMGNALVCNIVGKIGEWIRDYL